MKPLLVSLLSLFMFQDPVPIPAPLHFNCTSPISPTLAVQMDLDRNPIEALRMIIRNVKPNSSDITSPVITAITDSAKHDVLTNTGVIAAATNGVPLTVFATDDVEIAFWSLEVDGYQVTTGMKGATAIPNPFYVRWNESALVGNHMFVLMVVDANGNHAEKQWTMKR